MSLRDRLPPEFPKGIRIKPELRNRPKDFFLNHEWTPMNTNRSRKILRQATQGQRPWEFVSIRVDSWWNFGIRINPNAEVATRTERGCPQPQRFEHTRAVQKFSGPSSPQPAAAEEKFEQQSRTCPCGQRRAPGANPTSAFGLKTATFRPPAPLEVLSKRP